MDKKDMYKKFLDWMHKENIGDGQVIAGGEIFLLSIALLWKFNFYSQWFYILKYEHYILFLSINIGLFIILLTGLIFLIYGFVLKFNNRK